jgi:hypothetical protein
LAKSATPTVAPAVTSAPTTLRRSTLFITRPLLTRVLNGELPNILQRKLEFSEAGSSMDVISLAGDAA